VSLSSSTADPGTGNVIFQVDATVKGAPPPILPPTPTDTSTDTTSSGSS